MISSLLPPVGTDFSKSKLMSLNRAFQMSGAFLGSYKTRFFRIRGLKTDYWPAGRLQDPPRHPALLPTEQLCVDVMRRFLPTHVAGGGLHLRVATRQMAVRSWLGHATGPHCHLHIPAGM